MSEIRSGGPSRDGIPSIDEPVFETVADLADALVDSEPVMSLEIDGDARAYPLNILIWHEIVNDTVGDTPVAVTYCPLCNSGIVFERRVGGRETTFGTTGRLRKSNLIMYDRLTETWFQQVSGRGIIGEFAGLELTQLPARLESFAEFRTRFPEGKVLVPNDTDLRPYGSNPYVGYDSSTVPFMFDGEYDGPGSPVMRVVAIDGRDEAWSLNFLREVGTVSVGDLLIRWKPGQNSAMDTREIALGRDVGSVTVQRARPGGVLEDVPYHVSFAFAFRAFKPEAPIRHVE